MMHWVKLSVAKWYAVQECDARMLPIDLLPGQLFIFT